MKKVVVAFLFVCIVVSSFAQANLSIHGKVTNKEGIPVPGVVIKFDQVVKGAVTNIDGNYELTGLISGNYTIHLMYMGYSVVSEEIVLNTINKNADYTIDEQTIKLEAVTVSARKREEDLQRVPLAISVADRKMLDQNEIRGLDELAAFVPGMYVQQHSTQRPYIVIRGMASDNFNPSSQPRVSVYLNNVPVSRSSGSSLDLFDMDRVEVLKGPANSLFGRGAMNGSVQYITAKASNQLEGKIALGTGSYKQSLVEGMVNAPLNDKLAVRFAGLYEDREGYVDNSFGGTLMGKNATSGRLSFRYLASSKSRFDLVFNYQQNDAPGVAFMSRQFPNVNGEVDVFSGLASFDQGDLLGTFKENQSVNLDFIHHFTDALSLSTVTSYRKHEASERWDGDGTAAKALDFEEQINSDQFYQEVRVNLDVDEKFKAVAGASYLRENIDQTYQLYPNEQHFFHLFFDRNMLIGPDGQPISVPALPAIPQLGQLGGMPLPTDHEETSFSEAVNQGIELFWNGSYQIDRKWSLSAGMRLVFDRLELETKQTHSGGSPSTLGMLAGSYPNLLFLPHAQIDSSANFSGLTGNLSVQYQASEQLNIYAGYSLGRRPNVLQSNNRGGFEVLDPEKVHGIDAGIKANINKNLLFNVALFYQDYSDFQTNVWDTNLNTLIVKDGGQATSYGLEADVQYALHKNIKFYGSYSWLKARFDKEDGDGIKQAYSGFRFRLAPDHSFSLGIHAQTDLSEDVNLFINPSFTWQDMIYFEDNNSDNIRQDAYGLLNLKLGVRLKKLNTTISGWAHNLAEKEYYISGGNAGSLFQIPTFVPGVPRIMGAKITYQF